MCASLAELPPGGGPDVWQPQAGLRETLRHAQVIAAALRAFRPTDRPAHRRLSSRGLCLARLPASCPERDGFLEKILSAFKDAGFHSPRGCKFKYEPSCLSGLRLPSPSSTALMHRRGSVCPRRRSVPYPGPLQCASLGTRRSFGQVSLGAPQRWWKVCHGLRLGIEQLMRACRAHREHSRSVSRAGTAPKPREATRRSSARRAGGIVCHLARRRSRAVGAHCDLRARRSPPRACVPPWCATSQGIHMQWRGVVLDEQHVPVVIVEAQGV